MKNDESTIYKLLHTGNKPNGSYTGNGNNTNRQVSTGGIGSVLHITYNNGNMVLVNQWGAFCINGSTITTLSYTECYFKDGMLSITSTNPNINGNGTVYNYQVL